MNFKFRIEINTVEVFKDLFVIKVFKNNIDRNQFTKICNTLFENLKL